ncbi:MAG: GAF domain-containing protein [Anaerolineales bacterium]|nr:GAF domain-containing protein [Anaerolineales bacterium]
MNTTSLSLTRRYVLALSLVALLSITAFFILRIAITAQETSAAVVNVAGRQRMLSQRISRFALLLVLNKNTTEETSLRETLQSNVALFEASHTGLLKGGTVTDISSDEVLALPGDPSPVVQEMYFDAPMNLDQQVTAYVAEARSLLEAPESELTLDNPHLQYLLTASASEILTSLNTVTGQYQKESETAIARLAALEAGVLGVTLLTLLVTALFIFRPMVQQITKNTRELEEKSKLTELQNLQLEQRVEDRTKALATVAEVGTATATILETDKLLQEVVNLSKERFNLYHSHIYLLDENSKNLVLASGAGEPGRQMMAKGFSIPLDREQSLVARAARERKGVIVNDVTQAPDFLPNPLLPDTRSELAIPMIVGGKVIGVFDVQSDVVGRFTESDINIQTTLATQVATSIQNVRVFEQSKSQADLASLVNAIGQKIQRATTVDDTLQTAIRELGLALGASRVSANIQANRQADGR